VGSWSRPALNGIAPQKPSGCDTRPVLKGPRVVWRGPYGATRWHDPIHFMFGEKPGVAFSRVEFLIFYVRGPSSLARSGGHIQYGVHSSPTICRCREPVVSRLLGHNWWPTVPGVLDPMK
jgi:hypothetical protein